MKREKLDRLGEILQESVNKHEIAGGNLLVMHHGEEIYYAQAGMADIAQGNTDFSSVYARESGNEKCCYVLIAGDRGLAGGYNTNLFKCLEAASVNQDFLVLPIGKKAVEYSKRNGFACVTESFGEIADVSVADCFEMANLLCGEF